MPTILCFIALCILFLKLPGVPEIIGLKECASCSTATPYLPMLAASYFAFLLTATLCFQSLPTKTWRWSGFIWALGLAISLTYLRPQVCWICLVAHTCHIALWIIWKPKQKQEKMIGMKFALAFTSSLALMALFSTLNLTFLVYKPQIKNPVNSLVKVGSIIKPFVLDVLTSKELADYKGVIFHFVSPSCPYCKEQIPQLDRIAQEYRGKGYRFINVSHRLTSELRELGRHLEWIEDESLSSLLGIQGFPTLIMVDRSGVVVQTIEGSSTNFEAKLLSQLGHVVH